MTPPPRVLLLPKVPLLLGLDEPSVPEPETEEDWPRPPLEEDDVPGCPGWLDGPLIPEDELDEPSDPERDELPAWPGCPGCCDDELLDPIELPDAPGCELVELDAPGVPLD